MKHNKFNFPLINKVLDVAMPHVEDEEKVSEVNAGVDVEVQSQHGGGRRKPNSESGKN